MKMEGYSGLSKFNVMGRFNVKNESASRSTFDVLVRTRRLLHEKAFFRENRVNSDSDSGGGGGDGSRVDDSVKSDHSNKNNYNNSNSSSDSNNSSSGSNNSNSKSSGNSIGMLTVRQILDSQWLVEELLLETRHARLEIKKE